MTENCASGCGRVGMIVGGVCCVRRESGSANVGAGGVGHSAWLTGLLLSCLAGPWDVLWWDVAPCAARMGGWASGGRGPGPSGGCWGFLSTNVRPAAFLMNLFHYLACCRPRADWTLGPRFLICDYLGMPCRSLRTCCACWHVPTRAYEISPCQPPRLRLITESMSG